MFLEKLFGNIFGLIWLIVFTLGILALLVWMIIKKDKVISEEVVEEVKKEYLKEEYSGFLIEENENNKYEVKKDDRVLKTFDVVSDAKMFIDVLLLREEENQKESVYEIVEIDGFFKVRKKGSERTIRKFATLEEAEKYVKEKEIDD